MTRTAVFVNTLIQVPASETCILNLFQDFLALFSSFLLLRSGMFCSTATAGPAMTIQQINDSKFFRFSTDTLDQGSSLAVFIFPSIWIQDSPIPEFLSFENFVLDGTWQSSRTGQVILNSLIRHHPPRQKSVFL